MSNKNEKPYHSIHDKEQFIHTSADFINALRLSVIGLKVSEEQYKSFDTLAVEIMTDILQVYEKLIEEQDDVAPKHVRQMTIAKDTVQDGLADMVADKQDGMDYRTFCIQLEEWKGRWFDQLRVS